MRDVSTATLLSYQSWFQVILVTGVLALLLSTAGMHFDVVGVVDRLDDGLVCLSRMYNWEFEGIGRLNTGVNKTELIERDVALRRLVEDQNRYDIELYDYCRRRFDEQATQLL